MTNQRPEAAYSDGMTDDHRLRAIDDAPGDPAREAHTALEATMFEVKRVIVGQEAMLERLAAAMVLAVWRRWTTLRQPCLCAASRWM
jgi:hypothetical protein